MRTVMIARRVGVVIAVLGAVMVLDPKGTASAQATPQAPAPQAAAQAAPQGAPGCPGGNCQPIVNYIDYNCPYYYPVPYPVCYYYNVNVGDYPPECPGGNCGPSYGAAPTAPTAPATTPQAPH